MTKSRFDPVIESSKYLSSIIKSGNDSSKFKQIGSSQLFTGGTKGKAIISIPVDYLSIDELDFCDQEKVATAESRMTHSRFIDDATGIRGIKRKWSTPTAIGVGVDKLFDMSNQLRRLVKCKSCQEWFWPQFLKHVVVKGWDKPMDEMTYVDAMGLDKVGHLKSAKLLCENCHGVVTKANLMPDYREWVASYPSRTSKEGWHISPFDLPDYHTPQSILMKMIDYGNNVNHFRNFVLGIAHSDASNSVLDTAIDESTVIRPVPPEQAAAQGIRGCVAGLDIGKTSWLIIGKPDFVTRNIDILWVEAIRLRDDTGNDLVSTVLQRIAQYKVMRMVCDATPYTDSILTIQERMPEGWVMPNYYTQNDKKLPMYVVNEKEWSLSSNRTKTLNLTAKKANMQTFRWPTLPEMSTVRTHLQGMKRVDRIGDTGEEESDWVRSGDDHYFHALNYMNMAFEIEAEQCGGWSPVPTVKEVVVGETFEVEAKLKQIYEDRRRMSRVNL